MPDIILNLLCYNKIFKFPLQKIDGIKKLRCRDKGMPVNKIHLAMIDR